MPSQIAHSLIGESALSAAAPETAGILLDSDRAPWFRLGCQGPDIFYHSQRTRPVALHYGVLAHRRNFGRLVEGLTDAWVREDGDPESPWAAFLLGFATHAALDRATHPFIVFFSGWPDPRDPKTERYRGCHAFLERILDALLWERTTGSAVSAFDAERFLSPSQDVPEELPTRIAEALRTAFPSETANDSHLAARAANALADTRRFYALTNPARTSGVGVLPENLRYLAGAREPRSVSVLYPESISRSVDWANEAGRVWNHPCRQDPPRTESFFDLCEAAKKEAAEVLKLLLRGFRSRAVPDGLREAAGDATLNVGDEEGRPDRPRFCRPLPLPDFLAEEFRARRIQAEGLPH